MLNGYLRSRRGATIVVVSNSGVRISERGAWTTGTIAALAGPEILDVDYSSRGGVTVKTRKGLTTFGKRLDAGEISYLHWVIRRALADLPP